MKLMKLTYFSEDVRKSAVFGCREHLRACMIIRSLLCSRRVEAASVVGRRKRDSIRAVVSLAIIFEDIRMSETMYADTRQCKKQAFKRIYRYR